MPTSSQVLKHVPFQVLPGCSHKNQDLVRAHTWQPLRSAYFFTPVSRFQHDFQFHRCIQAIGRLSRGAFNSWNRDIIRTLSNPVHVRVYNQCLIFSDPTASHIIVTSNSSRRFVLIIDTLLEIFSFLNYRSFQTVVSNGDVEC